MCAGCGETHARHDATKTIKRFCHDCRKIRDREIARACYLRNRVSVPRHTPWTDERKQEAVKLMRNGLSRGQIAKCFGVTRNAVVGILHRMGMSTPRTEPSAAELEERRQRKRENDRQRHREYVRRHREQNPEKYRAAQARYRAKQPITPRKRSNISMPLYPQSLNQPLIETTGCRFMPGNDFLCCGQPQQDGSSYCEHHHQITHWKP